MLFSIILISVIQILSVNSQTYLIPAGTYTRASMICTGIVPTTCDYSCTSVFTVTLSGSYNEMVPANTNSGCSCFNIQICSGVGTYNNGQVSVPFTITSLNLVIGNRRYCRNEI